ncbi:hypothetical protein [Cupriavidus oxalaticus]|uniref:Uncharacterized protein n=1 Tax=Cupriavidus oxalaticus TaxID=96344 RepID=A0A4P7LJN8_9BURK|nr:hypothetical protein [Cupriavidus oxalaticus]QBY56356.1 hypothetical protein E0W60_35715 [Cupriavidus oxalaticus]
MDDKLQMTVTLSEPELLAYLRQFSGARERSFMLRMLALRGLQSGRSGVSDNHLWPPMAGSPTHTRPEQVPVAVPSPPLQETRIPEPAVPTLQYQASMPTPATTPAPPASGVTNSPATGPGNTDPLAGIDIDALNNAIARY